MESESWRSNQPARAQMLGQPPEGEHVQAPPENQVVGLLAMQLGGGGQRGAKPFPTGVPSPTAIREFEKYVQTTATRDFVGPLVITAASRNNFKASGTVTLNSADILQNNNAASDAWNKTMDQIRKELTGAGYNNIQIELRAHVHYTCTNVGAQQPANLEFNITFIIDVQATKLGDNYLRILNVLRKGEVTHEGTPGSSYQ